MSLFISPRRDGLVNNVWRVPICKNVRVSRSVGSRPLALCARGYVRVHGKIWRQDLVHPNLAILRHSPRSAFDLVLQPRLPEWLANDDMRGVMDIDACSTSSHGQEQNGAPRGTSKLINCIAIASAAVLKYLGRAFTSQAFTNDIKKSNVLGRGNDFFVRVILLNVQNGVDNGSASWAEDLAVRSTQQPLLPFFQLLLIGCDMMLREKIILIFRKQEATQW